MRIAARRGTKAFVVRLSAGLRFTLADRVEPATSPWSAAGVAVLLGENIQLRKIGGHCC